MSVPLDPHAARLLRPADVKQIFDCAETSQALLDAFFQVCSGYFPVCALLLFVGDELIIRRVHGPGQGSGAVGARIPTAESPALAPIQSGDLGAAAVTVEASDALVVCGVWPAPGEALLLPLVVRGRASAAVIGENRISEQQRRDILSITSSASTTLQSIIARRSTAAAVSDATRILSEPLKEEALAAKRKRIAIGASIATGVAVLGTAALWFFGGKSPLAVPISDLPGQPHVDAVAMMPVTKKASGLGDGAELIEIRATVTPDGKTDLSSAGLSEGDAWPLRITFAGGNTVAEMDVDRAGVYPPAPRARGAGRSECGACGCDVGAPAPHCATKALLDSARGAGLAPTESAVLTYSFCRAEGPRWTLGVRGRGEIRLSDSACTPLPRESLHMGPRTVEMLQKGPKLNPLDLLAEAKKQAGISDGVLLRFEAWSVARDGTLDLNNAAGRRARAEYTFADPPSPSAPSRVRRVVLDAEGMSVQSTELVKANLHAAPDPRCTLDKLWRSGVGEAPNSALAHIIYEADPAPPLRGQWTIDLAATAIHQLRSDVVCAAWD